MENKSFINWITIFFFAFVLSCGDNLPGDDINEDQKTGNRLVKMAGDFFYEDYDDSKLLVKFGYDNKDRIYQSKSFWDDVIEESLSIIYGNDQIEFSAIDSGEKYVTTYYLNEYGNCYREEIKDTNSETYTNKYYYNSNGHLTGIELER